MDMNAGVVVHGSQHGQEGGATGVLLSAAPGVVLGHLTVRDVAGEATRLDGVTLLGGADSPVVILDSIISTVGGPCLWSADDNDAGLLQIAYSLLDGCGDDVQAENATVHGTTSYLDPLFEDPEAGDLHLKGPSPGVDAAKEDSDFCNEPAPNGGRANLGAYGNTAEAASNPHAEHVACD